MVALFLLLSRIYRFSLSGIYKARTKPKLSYNLRLWAKDNQLSIVDCSQIFNNFAIGELYADENDRRFLHT